MFENFCYVIGNRTCVSETFRWILGIHHIFFLCLHKKLPWDLYLGKVLRSGFNFAKFRNPEVLSLGSSITFSGGEVLKHRFFPLHLPTTLWLWWYIIRGFHWLCPWDLNFHFTESWVLMSGSPGIHLYGYFE